MNVPGASIVTIHIEEAETDAQVAATFAVMRQLRPHLVEDDYVPLIRSLMASDGLRLTAVLTAWSVPSPDGGS